ncbi:22271_t:CDS:2 [Cetraspora pellucida]|uniref:22271_t:CDS:1 n=1 Tax=Cetraspora pellucida TaxID=1433469 RepID=A0A9N9NJ88_9GLOM|nr:22271_t:CDS:2 [Cetraspora pellucida]
MNNSRSYKNNLDTNSDNYLDLDNFDDKSVYNLMQDNESIYDLTQDNKSLYDLSQENENVYESTQDSDLI